MWLYNSIFFSVILSITFLKKKYYKFMFEFFFLICWFLSFIRWEVGTDWDTYYYIFDKKIEEMAYVNEIGFRMLNYYVHKITNNYTMLLFLMATIIYRLKYLIIKKYSKNILLSLLVFFSLYKADIFFVRMTVAIAINFYSFKYILRKKFIKFIICILCAYIFHRTAIIFLIAYPIVNYIKFSKKKMWYIFFLAIFLYLFNFEILNFCNLFLKNIDIEFIKKISFKFNLYIETKNLYFGNDQRNLIGNLRIFIAMANRIFIYFVILWKSKNLDFYTQKSLLLYGIGFILYFMLTPISIPLGRLTSYFDIFELLIIPNIYMTIKNNLVNKIFLSVSFVYFYLKLLSGIYIYYNLFIPYKTIFNI